MEDLRRGLRLMEIAHRDDLRGGSRLPPRFTSQSGEDLLIYGFFKDAAPGFFVEAGAYDGVNLSNTYLLESLGWRGLLVEPHPRQAEACRSNRPGSRTVHAALGPDSAEGEVELTCVENDLGSQLSYVKADRSHTERCKREARGFCRIKVPYVSLKALLGDRTEKVDLLSLDVEGMELDVLRGFDLERYQPSLIVIEQQGDERDAAVSAYLEKHGYRQAAKKGCNAFFVPEALRASFESQLYAGEKADSRYGC
jgi:FkbM family methyltransferase